MDPSDDSSNQFRRDFLPSINDPLLAQRSVVNGDGGRVTEYIPTGEIPVVPFGTAFSEYLLAKELATAGVSTRTRTKKASGISKVGEQQLVTKQQSVPKQQPVVTHQLATEEQLGAKVAEQQLVTEQQSVPKQQPVVTHQLPTEHELGGKNSQGVASTEKAHSLDSEVLPVVAIKQAQTSTVLPNGLLLKVVVFDAAGKSTLSSVRNNVQLDHPKEFPRRVRDNVCTISPAGNVDISLVLGRGQVGFECGYNAIGQGAKLALENDQPNGVAGNYGIGIDYECAPNGNRYREPVDSLVKALNVHILNLAHDAVRKGQETDYHEGLISSIRNEPAGATFLRASMLPSAFRYELDRLLAQPPPLRQSPRGLQVVDQLHCTIEWPDGQQGPTNNRRNVIIFPLHCGAGVQTKLADNVTIDIDGRMWFFDHFLGQLSEGSFITLSEYEIWEAEAENMGALEPVDDFLEIPPAQDDAGVLLVIGNLSEVAFHDHFSFVRTLHHINNLTDEQAESPGEGREQLDALFGTWERVRAEYAAQRKELLATNAMAITRRNAITGFAVLPSTRCVDAAFSS